MIARFSLILFIFCLVQTTAQSQGCFENIKQRSILENNYVTDLTSCFDRVYYSNISDSLFQFYPLLKNCLNQGDNSLDNKEKMEINYRLGKYFSVIGIPNTAIDHLIESLRFAELTDDANSKGRVLKELGLLNYGHQRWKDAIEYFKQASQNFRVIGDSRNLSTAHYLSGLALSRNKEYRAAVNYLDSALSIATLKADSARMYECLLGIANNDLKLNKIESAEQGYNTAKEYYKDKNEPVAMAYIYNGLAQIAVNRKDLGEAFLKAKNAKAFAAGMPDPEPLLDASMLLFKINKELGKPELALIHLEQYQKQKDSLASMDISTQVALATSNYRFEKEAEEFRKEIAENQRNKKFMIGAISFLILVIIGALGAYYTVRRERQRSENLLLNILPKDTADELKAHGRALPKQHQGVSIVFCDVVGFTSITERLHPEDLVTILDQYFGSFDDVVLSQGVEKIKTIGDAYMAVSGLFADDEKTNARKAVSAALLMLEECRRLGEEIKKVYGFTLNFRFGIHTGTVISGVVGKRKYAYDVWGDAVNVAARMEQNSEPGKLNISGDTFELIEDHFDTIYRGKISAKNKGEIDMYFIAD